MIGSLRRKFVAIVMALVGAVLVFMLAFSFWRNYTMQWSQVDHDLAISLEEDDGFIPVIGRDPVDQDGAGRSARLVAKVSVDSSGLIVAASDSSATVDEDVLADVTEAALSTSEENGRLPSSHVAWASRVTSSGGMLIAIADTTDVDASLRSQAMTGIVALLASLAALFAIAWFLSSWALRPVEAAWEQQRRFVADASHELKTPLAVITANLGIVQKDPNLPPDDVRWVDSSMDAAGQMQGLVTDLLELARTDETKAGDADAMRKADVDFSDIVESAALEFDAVAFERRCALDMHVEEGVRLDGDRDWLDRMVRILIDNAIKYAAPDTQVGVTLARKGGRCVLSVTNLGPVIPPDDLVHVFDRFYRSDTARSRQTGGFGLGLAIAKGIAEAHGGSIAAASSEAEGTTFTVTI